MGQREVNGMVCMATFRLYVTFYFYLHDAFFVRCCNEPVVDYGKKYDF